MRNTVQLYFDNAATTRLHPSVLMAMMPYLTDQYGNPSGIYERSRSAKKALDKARDQVASAIGAQPEEIFFTGSGTEADNWAIKGVMEANHRKGRHMITTAIEHHAVLHTCEYLAKQGCEVTYLPVDAAGFINMEALASAIRPDTVLISVMFANNEIGTIQPVEAIARLAREKNVLLHTDAVQAVGHVPINVRQMPVDLLTMSAHKFYGPKGVGALYVKKGVRLSPLLHGGAQEGMRRAGTENVAGIVGLGEAIALTHEEMSTEFVRVSALRDKLIHGISNTIPHARLNGPGENQGHLRLPGNVNFSFDFIEGESLLLLLDMQGCYASTGSACSSGSLDPSHVLLALGLPHEKAHGSIRFTMGRYSTAEEVDALLAMLPPIVMRLREMSPLYEAFLANAN